MRRVTSLRALQYSAKLSFSPTHLGFIQKKKSWPNILILCVFIPQNHTVTEMRGVGGPLLCISDLLSDVAEEASAVPHDQAPPSDVADASKLLASDLPKLFQVSSFSPPTSPGCFVLDLDFIILSVFKQYKFKLDQNQECQIIWSSEGKKKKKEKTKSYIQAIMSIFFIIFFPK